MNADGQSQKPVTRIVVDVEASGRVTVGYDGARPLLSLHALEIARDIVLARQVDLEEKRAQAARGEVVIPDGDLQRRLLSPGND
jgi:hypothetical protein